MSGTESSANRRCTCRGDRPTLFAMKAMSNAGFRNSRSTTLVIRSLCNHSRFDLLRTPRQRLTASSSKSTMASTTFALDRAVSSSWLEAKAPMIPAASTAASDDRGTLTKPSTFAIRRTDGTSSLFNPTATKSNASMKSNSAAPDVGRTTRSRESITNSLRAMRTTHAPCRGTITNKSEVLSTILHRIENRVPSSCRSWIGPKACRRAVARNASSTRGVTSTAAPKT